MVNGGQQTQALPDEDVQDLLKDLESLGIDSDDLPDFLTPEEDKDGAGDGQAGDDEKSKKAKQAFFQMRDQLRRAKKLLQDQPKPDGGTPQPGAGAGAGAGAAAGQAGRATPVDQANAFMSQLQVLAMQRTGIADIRHPLVGMEVQRLYAERMAEVQARQTAPQQAPQVLDQAFEAFPMLADDDRAAIKKRISGLDVLEQVKPDVVRDAIQFYIGQNFTKFTGGRSDDGEGTDDDASGGSGWGKPPASERSSGADRAAASPARAGRGPRPPDKSDGGFKPAAVDEIKAMRKLKLDPSDRKSVELFRRSKKKAAGYDSHAL